MNKEEIIQELNLKSFGSKGWMGSSTLICPECGRSDKSGIIFTENSAKFHCMRCSIGMYVNKYLKLSGKSHLVQTNEFTASNEHKLKSLVPEEIEEEIVVNLPEKKLPIGCRPINSDEYLESRGFSNYHFDLFKPVETKLDLSRKGYIIFQIFDMNNVRVAWLGRSRRSKEWHKDNEKKHKEEGERLVLRYDNSKDTDFSNILGGVMELTDEVDTVILVEGLFDKVNVDNELGLPNNENIKCLFTFGDSIKEGQLRILEQFKNIKLVYLLYDYGTIANSKRYGLEIESKLHGVEVMICEVNIINADPGSLPAESLINILNKSVRPLEFNKGKLNKKLC